MDHPWIIPRFQAMRFAAVDFHGFVHVDLTSVSTASLIYAQFVLAMLQVMM